MRVSRRIFSRSPGRDRKTIRSTLVFISRRSLGRRDCDTASPIKNLTIRGAQECDELSASSSDSFDFPTSGCLLARRALARTRPSISKRYFIIGGSLDPTIRRLHPRRRPSTEIHFLGRKIAHQPRCLLVRIVPRSLPDFFFYEGFFRPSLVGS